MSGEGPPLPFEAMVEHRLAAEAAVRDLVHRYALAVDRGRFDDAADLFAEDAVFELGERAWRGPEGVLAMLRWAAESVLGDPPSGATAVPTVRHHLTTQVVEVDGPGSASSQSYFLAVVGDRIDHWGRYLDRCAVVGGRWQFTRRRDVVDGAVPGGWAAASR
jgi:hypothetical protein